MPVIVEETPNPNALKFTVGAPVGGPVTYRSADDGEDAWVRALFETGGVQQVFMTADFVSVTKTGEAEWSELVGPVREVIERQFGGA